jgi:hypothetical protein
MESWITGSSDFALALWTVFPKAPNGNLMACNISDKEYQGKISKRDIIEVITCSKTAGLVSDLSVISFVDV